MKTPEGNLGAERSQVMRIHVKGLIAVCEPAAFVAAQRGPQIDEVNIRILPLWRESAAPLCPPPSVQASQDHQFSAQPGGNQGKRTAVISPAIRQSSGLPG
jgi:hypothetical protein